METTGLEPASAENTASVEATEVDSEVGTTEGAAPATAADETGKPAQPERDKVQERFDKLTREKYEGLSRAERAEYRAQLLEQQLAELRQSQAKTEPVAPADEFPTLESCGFDENLLRQRTAEFYAKQSREAVKAELEAEREEAEQAKTEQEWSRREAEFIKSKPDYAEKVLRPPSAGGPVVTDHMAQVLKALPEGPEIAYYLGENPAKSAEIARLPEYLQSAELGTIRARLEAAKAAPPPVSKAPPPAPKVDSAESGGSVSTTDPASDKLMNDDQWFKAELKRMARKAARN